MKRSVPHAFISREQVTDLNVAFTNALTEGAKRWTMAALDWRLQVTPERVRVAVWLDVHPDETKVAVDIATEEFFLVAGYETQLVQRAVEKLLLDVNREPRR